MLSFEILCVTMHQTGFEKIKSMNIHSDVVFANQSDTTNYQELNFEGHKAKMITTATRGVGINRNLALMYASADICLFADDDVTYADDMEKLVVDEFETHPDADVIIFNLDTDSQERKQRHYSVTKKHHRWERMPWGGCRIAVRLSAVRKANIWFSLLFGGGAPFPSGEDSLWLKEAKRKGLVFYVSKNTIGKVSFEESSWFTGKNEKYFYGKGAFYAASNPKSIWLWMLYFAFRIHDADIPFKEQMFWMNEGRKGYSKMTGFGVRHDKC